ncbi:MAG: TolC family protein [Bacteroidaceae bacterium]
MNKKFILLGAFATLISTGNAQTGSINEVIRSIEQNNSELQATEQSIQSQKLTTRTDNNLPDPTVNYSYLFGSPQEIGKTGELTLTQGFDFPTLYADRSRYNKLKAGSFDRQYEVARRNILLNAKDLCLDLVMLRHQKALLAERLTNAQELSAIYEKRLATGDANILETNKIKLELQAVATEHATNESAIHTALQSLQAMNGGKPIDFTQADYTPMVLPADYKQLRNQLLTSDPELQALESEKQAAQKQITVNKGGWLPKLEVGYRRNTGLGEQFNGFIVGGSLPLFSNRHKVKIARAQSLTANLQQESSKQQADTRLTSLYAEANQLQRSISTYDVSLMRSTLELLKQALNARQISMIEYFAEITVIYQSQSALMQLQNRYQKVMAQLFRDFAI